MHSSDFLLHLSLLPGIGPTTSKKIAQLMIEQQIDWYALSVSDWMRLGFGQVMAQKLVTGLQDTVLVEQEKLLLEKTGVSWVTLLDDLYPTLLKHTYAPPSVLYWQGEPVWHNADLLAVVGSRDGTGYGKRAVQALVAPCVGQGLVIVSGGARGIDTMAHEAALVQDGKTIVVLGSGLLKPYPLSNKELFKQVVQSGGAVVSCFPLQTSAQPWQFPIRNRIIAGMSSGCLVVQAARESGALITAQYALNEGRNVYAVPGPFDEPLSQGCHLLLQEGAQLTTTAEGIFADYRMEYQLAKASVVLEKDASREQKQVDVTSQKQKNHMHPLVALCADPISFDELVEQTQKDENELKIELFELQLAGLLQQDFAGLWSRP